MTTSMQAIIDFGRRVLGLLGPRRRAHAIYQTRDEFRFSEQVPGMANKYFCSRLPWLFVLAVSGALYMVTSTRKEGQLVLTRCFVHFTAYRPPTEYLALAALKRPCLTTPEASIKEPVPRSSNKIPARAYRAMARLAPAISSYVHFHGNRSMPRRRIERSASAKCRR